MHVDAAPGPVAGTFHDRRRAWEEEHLAPAAARSWPARRAVAEPDCTLRSPFQRDRDRIVHCKAFRRLKHKTQVFVAPEGDHFRTRLTHTLEVTQIARTVARALALNEDLTEAIGLAHDLGHPPFGHIGEAVLDRCLARRFGGRFRHYEHSLRVVERLEPPPTSVAAVVGAGLNLDARVRDGIAGHSGRAPLPGTLEGRIVRLVDRVAYLNHDIDDALRAEVLDDADLPPGPIARLGNTGSQRIDTLVHDLVETSWAAGDIVQGEEAATAMAALRDFMFSEVYLGEAARREHAKIERVVSTLFDHFVDHPEDLPPARGEADPARDEADLARGETDLLQGQAHLARGEGELAQRVTDHVAGMTDRYAVRAFARLSVPVPFEV